MELLGQPFIIQNTTTGWVVTWDGAVRITTRDGDPIEEVSFTVRIPRQAELTIEEVQTFALKRAAELLKDMIHHQQQRNAPRDAP